MEKKREFDRICRNIKDMKIQGAEAVAIAGIKAYSLIPSIDSIRKLVILRATEPTLVNALKYSKIHSPGLALKHFKYSDRKLDRIAKRIIKNNSVIFTHCHSSNVVDLMISAKKRRRRFRVVNTETRPLYQGRKTAKELSKEGIKVTSTVDAAAMQQIKNSDIVLIGCDAVLSNGNIINKIGSGMFANIANDFKKPVYIITDSWKFSPDKVKIEERNFKEVWKKLPKNVRIKNPAFEVVEAKYITAIVSELGILKPKDFVKRVKKVYPWIR